MQRTKDVLNFALADTYKSATLSERGHIRSIVLKLPDFTTATKVSQIDFLDDDGDIYYTNTNTGAGWAKNANHVISGLEIPISQGYQVKVTLDDAAGGAHSVTVKTYIETTK